MSSNSLFKIELAQIFYLIIIIIIIIIIIPLFLLLFLLLLIFIIIIIIIIIIYLFIYIFIYLKIEFLLETCVFSLTFTWLSPSFCKWIIISNLFRNISWKINNLYLMAVWDKNWRKDWWCFDKILIRCYLLLKTYNILICFSYLNLFKYGIFE